MIGSATIASLFPRASQFALALVRQGEPERDGLPPHARGPCGAVDGALANPGKPKGKPGTVRSLSNQGMSGHCNACAPSDSQLPCCNTGFLLFDGYQSEMVSWNQRTTKHLR